LNPKRRRWLVLLTGWGFVLLGILGLFLPFLQGVLFLLIGLLVLSGEYVWAHKLLQKLQQRFPAFSARIHEATERLRRRAGRPASDA